MPSANRLIIPNRRPLWKPSGQQLTLDPTHPLTRGLVHAYIFNERGGSPRSLVNPNHSISLGSGVTWSNSPYGPALTFNKTANGKGTFSSAFTPATGHKFSVDMAVRVTTSPATFDFNYLLGATAAGANGLFVTNSSPVLGWDIDTATTDLSVGSLPTLNVWYHVVFTINATSGVIYQNGLSVASGTIADDITYPLGWLGSDGTNVTNSFGGDIAWVRIWDARVLTADEVMALYLSPFENVVSPQETMISYAILGGFVSGATNVSVSDSATGSESYSADAIFDSTPGSPRGQGMSAPWRTTQRIPLSIWGMMGGSSPTPYLGDVAIAAAEQFYGNGTQGEPFNPHGQASIGPFRVAQRVSMTTLAPGYNPPPETQNGGAYNDLTRNVIDQFYGLTFPFDFAPQDTSATGAEALALSATMGLSDTGTGTDTAGITATLPISDAATGTDTPGIEADLPITDSATGTETLAIEVDIPLTDTATGTETVGVTVIAPPAAPVTIGVPRGQGMSAPWRTTQRIPLSIWNMMGGSSPSAIRDVALAAAEQFYGNGTQGYPFAPLGQFPMAPLRETQRVSLTTRVPGYTPPPDNWGGVDENDLTRNLVDTFYGMTFPFVFTPSDASATGADAVTLSATMGLSDTATGTDVTGITVTLPIPDSGTGTDTLALTAQLGVSDSGSGTDTPTITANVPVSDSGSGTDTPTLTVTFPLTDSATGAESVSVSAQLAISDAATGTDTPAITVQLTVTDSATGAEVLSKTVLVSISDSATGTDSVQVTSGGGSFFVNVTDVATGTETLLVMALSGRAIPTATMSGPGGVRKTMGGPGAARGIVNGPGPGSSRVVFTGD